MEFIVANIWIIMVVIVVIVAIIFLASIYKVASIDKALIITGGKEPVIKVSGGAFVIPIFRKADYFDLCMMTVTADKDEIKTATAVPIVADWTAQIRPCVSDPEKLRTAIVSFKERGNDGIISDVKLTLMGAVRDVVASMTPEQLLTDKEAFKQMVQKSVADEMDNMGLELVSLNIQDICDNNQYYDNIAALDSAEKAKAAQIKHAEVDQITREKTAEAGKAAEIAEARARQEASIARMDAELAEKEKRKETDMRLAEFRTATETANANADVAGELQKTIRMREVEEQRGAVAVMKAEQENLAAQKQREVIVTRAQAEKERKRVEAEAEAEVQKTQAEAKVKVAESNAQAIKLQAEAEAQKTKTEGLASAEVAKAKAMAEAEGKKAAMLADAEGVKAQKLAEAEGEKAIADARASSGKVNFEIEKLKIEAEARIKIATATAQIMADVGQNAEFVHIGGESIPMGSGSSKTGNILLDTLSQIPMLMKSVNVQNEALNGKPVTDEIRELSKAVLSGVNNPKKECDMDSGKECEIANGLEADGEGEMTNKLDSEDTEGMAKKSKPDDAEEKTNELENDG